MKKLILLFAILATAGLAQDIVISGGPLVIKGGMGTGGSATNATLLNGINGAATLTDGTNTSVRINGSTIYIDAVAGTGATGTPIYTESDPVWVSEKGSYATGTPLYVYTETDPIWTADYAAGLDLSTMTNAPAAWTNAGTGGGDTFSTNVLTSIADVDAPVPSASDVLTWDGSVWTNAPITRATWIECGAPPANWAVSDTNGAAQTWRLDTGVTNIYAGTGDTNHIEAFPVKVYPGTNSIAVGAATWGGTAAAFTNTYSLIDVMVDNDAVQLYLLRETD